MLVILTRASGPFQPSHDMMRKFYSLYKQATEGPCSMEKPPFYNLIQREKYNAWSALGDMTKEEAMTRYVEEIKQVRQHVPFVFDSLWRPISWMCHCRWRLLTDAKLDR